MGARRGIVTAGSWCVDYNKSIADWPAEDTSNEVLAVDRQGGGSACNMALDLKRLDPALPVETMGVVGDDDEARFLFAQCDAAGVERSGLLRLASGATMTVDAFNVKSNGRRTHFYHQGVAATLSPEHFDFSRSNAKILHLGLPGAHERMDSPWRGEANGWVVTLAAARREGIATNLELMTTARERIAALARPCLPHLDLLIVNDYEIGAVAGMETRRDGKADPPAIRAALAAALSQGAMRLAVAHFPEGAIALTRDGAAFAVGSVAAPKAAIAGVNGAGDAFAAGAALRAARGARGRRGVAARPRLRRRVDARGLDHRGGRQRRRMPGARRAMGIPPAASLTAGEAKQEREVAMDLGLKGKVAVVTGGSVGIGLAVADGLAAEGVNVVIAARGEERVRAEAARIAERHGVSALAVACDVATRAGTDRLIAETERAFGGADILINNAGTGSNETVMAAPDDKWQAYWDLHVMAAVRLARGLAPLMKKRGGGVILHTASICAAQPLWYEPIYNVTKAALMMFSKTLSTELIGDNIRVNCVNPGLILTPDWIKTAMQLTADKGGDWRPISTASPTSTRRSSASPAPRNWRISTSSSVRTAPATASARAISSTAGC